MSTLSRRRMAKVVQQARLIHVLVVCLTLVLCLGIGGRWALDPTQGGINSRLARLAFTEIGTAVLVVLEGFAILHWARWSFAQILPEGRAAQLTAIKRNEPGRLSPCGRASSQSLRGRLERGNAGLFFGLGMILLLTAFAGYLYDVRRIALAQIHAQDTLDLAAHRAGSDLDVPRFKKDQVISLAPDADGLALSTILAAHKEEYNLSVSSVRLLYGGAFMEIRGQMTVPLGFLSRSFGLGPAKRAFLSIIQPAYGIQRQND